MDARHLFSLGTCVEEHGKVTSGSFPLFQNPMGVDESDSLNISVVIASGELPGPTGSPTFPLLLVYCRYFALSRARYTYTCHLLHVNCRSIAPSRVQS